MTATLNETASLRTEQDVVVARQIVRRLAQEIGFSLVEQTKIVTATSELARNTVRHGRGGVMSCEVVQAGDRSGLRLTFIDEGPGIPDIARAMTDGYSTAGGLGMGLSGARRLVSEFDIESAPGKGTRVTVVRWR
jgi:serine/threonine-protein kinase RsbT